MGRTPNINIFMKFKHSQSLCGAKCTIDPLMATIVVRRAPIKLSGIMAELRLPTKGTTSKRGEMYIWKSRTIQTLIKKGLP